MTRKEFFTNHASTETKGSINLIAILTYIYGIMMAVASSDSENLAFFLEFIFVLSMGAGIQFAKSRVCAVLLMLYACICVIHFFAITGRLSGLLLPIIGFKAIQKVFELHEEYEQFQLSGDVSHYSATQQIEE